MKKSTKKTYEGKWVIAVSLIISGLVLLYANNVDYTLLFILNSAIFIAVYNYNYYKRQRINASQDYSSLNMSDTLSDMADKSGGVNSATGLPMWGYLDISGNPQGIDLD